MSRLRDCEGIIQVGKWMQAKGFSPGEHPKFGGVHPVHTSTSLHYKGLALDVNDNDVRDDKLPFDDEQEALRWLYHKILTVAKEHRWPLDEMFFDGFGFIKERGYGHNHPITGHNYHLHVGFSKATW